MNNILFLVKIKIDIPRGILLINIYRFDFTVLNYSIRIQILCMRMHKNYNPINGFVLYFCFISKFVVLKMYVYIFLRTILC